jgi:hypothetical protein
MSHALRNRSVHVLAGAVLSAALALTGTALAVESAHANSPAAPAIPAAATNNLTASPIKVRVNETVTYSGRTSGIPARTVVYLQQRGPDNVWRNVPNKTARVINNAYSIRDAFQYPGTKTMRTNAGGVLSNPVTINVTR